MTKPTALAFNPKEITFSELDEEDPDAIINSLDQYDLDNIDIWKIYVIHFKKYKKSYFPHFYISY